MLTEVAVKGYISREVAYKCFLFALIVVLKYTHLLRLWTFLSLACWIDNVDWCVGLDVFQSVKLVWFSKTGRHETKMSSLSETLQREEILQWIWTITEALHLHHISPSEYHSRIMFDHSYCQHIAGKRPSSSLVVNFSKRWWVSVILPSFYLLGVIAEDSFSSVFMKLWHISW